LGHESYYNTLLGLRQGCLLKNLLVIVAALKVPFQLALHPLQGVVNRLNMAFQVNRNLLVGFTFQV